MSKYPILFLLVLIFLSISGQGRLVRLIKFNFDNLRSYEYIFTTIKLNPSIFIENILNAEFNNSRTQYDDGMTELFEFENRVNHNNPLWDYPFPQETILTSSYSVHLPEPSQQKYSNLSRINNAVFFLGLEQLLNSHESILATGVWKTSPEIANLFAGFGKFDLFHDERLESAINYLSIAYQINPESCSSRYYLALALEKNQQGSKALPLLDLNDHSVCSQSISAELYYLRGKLLARQGKYLQALPDLQLAGNLDPESPEKLITLSNVLMVTEGNYNEIHLLLE